MSVTEVVDEIERKAFSYFVREVDPQTGLVRDNTRPTAPAAIGASGFALSCYALGAMRGYVSRDEAVERTRHALRFLGDASQHDGLETIGHRGFFYHFLSLDSGRRVWRCELSTIDSTILFAGALTALMYFDRPTPQEREIRELADALYRRAEWDWMMTDERRVSMGWHPESGFLRYSWEGYSEALLLYVLALGSPTHPLPAPCYAAWAESYRWLRIYGYDYLYAGPLFIHQLPQVWLDLRGVQDAFMRSKQIDYFENSRRATYVQHEYARRNPRAWKGYSDLCWGVTASDGPGPATRHFNGKLRHFMGYHARGVPYGPDDGTISPWAMVTSLPFAPEIVTPSMLALNAYGHTDSLNPSFSDSGWVSPAEYAINQGPVMLMIENYRSQALWRLMRRCPYVIAGLERAGFAGGWLEDAS